MKTSLVLSAGVLLLASACSGSSDKSTPTSQPTSATTTAPSESGPTITIASFQYSALSVAPGTTITVKNTDSSEHTVTSDTAGQFVADDVKKGTPVTFTAPSKPGKYTYHCEYHASMHGTLTVT